MSADLEFSSDDCHRVLLGYLNFSSGQADPKFDRALDALARRHGYPDSSGEGFWTQRSEELLAALDALAVSAAAFAESLQARSAIRLAFVEFPKRYKAHHSDLLAHQNDRTLFTPLFLSKVCARILESGSPWDEPDRVLGEALASLNDFVGHRPVAILRNGRQSDVYSHERVSTVPLYTAELGTCASEYEGLVSQALAILRAMDASLLDRAWFSFDRLRELDLDPRAYDYEHPVHSRPNYQFGEWDPHALDRRGYFRRFVLRQPLLDALMNRCASTRGDAKELMFESAAVLAGTMLMASGASGDEPSTHDSDVTLGKLMPIIAAYRDDFYQSLLSQRQFENPAHGQRLLDESQRLRQPFGGARQSLNRRLASMRSQQRLCLELANFFSSLGHADEAEAQVKTIQAVSARMLARIYALLQEGQRHTESGAFEDAWRAVNAAELELKRGIDCGAIVDPWNALGFNGQFSLFPALENSIHDRRLPILIRTVRAIFDAYALCWSRAAAQENRGEARDRVAESCRNSLERIASWWDKYATTEVGGLQSFSGAEAYQAARHVAESIGDWRLHGGAAGDIAFWRPRVAEFASSATFSRVVETLLRHNDSLAAMAVLVPWLSQVRDEQSVDPLNTFGRCVQDWANQVLAPRAETPNQAPAWKLAAKLLDYLEANAEEFWEAPRWETLVGLNPKAGLGDSKDRESPSSTSRKSDLGEPDPVDRTGGAGDEDDDESRGDLFEAAYEDVVYRDGSDDGNDSNMLERGTGATLHEWEHAARTLSRRLSFLQTVAWLWKRLANDDSITAEAADALDVWLTQAIQHRQDLRDLADALQSERMPLNQAATVTSAENDRRREIKESLVEKVIGAIVDTHEAAAALAARLLAIREENKAPTGYRDVELQAIAAMRADDAARMREICPDLFEHLLTQPVLYVPAGRGGDPRRVADARGLLRNIETWVQRLPQMGLLCETGQLLDTVLKMERSHSPGVGASTEFDRLYQTAYRGVMHALIQSATSSKRSGGEELVSVLDMWAQTLLLRWLAHSRSLRLAATERFLETKAWKPLKAFIEEYGADLFTQSFLALGNLRAIKSMGVDSWLAGLERSAEFEDDAPKLIGALGKSIDRAQAAQNISMIIDSVMEHYTHYQEYNATTTASDRGEMLYSLLAFFRLLSSYERVDWNLRPVLITHEILIREGRYAEAESWRQSLFNRTAESASEHINRYQKLCSEFGYQLPSIRQRLNERFVRPLLVDRIRSLVGQARFRADAVEDCTAAFRLLRQEIEELAKEYTEGGEESPFWIGELREELERIEQLDRGTVKKAPYAILSLERIQEELSRWQETSPNWW